MDLLSGADPVASWWLAILLAVVVTGVVALLLSWIIATAREIENTVAQIWAHGQRVANNTIHIAALHKTRAVAGAILERAGRIASSANQIRDHAKDCPGCPRCIWSGG